MVTCTVCGEDEFECIDGFYYCITCSTQSQDLRQEEQGDWVATGRSLTRSVAPRLCRERRTQSDHGRPWETEEGFQYILKSQVEALIKMGANPVLKDTVFSLWMKYLRQTGVLPSEDQDLRRALSNFRPRDRDIFPGSVKMPNVPVKRLKKSLEKKAGKMTAKKLELMQFQTSVGHEDFYEDDNPFEEDDSDDSDGEDKMTRKAQCNQIGRMSLRLTVCFCYAGLLLTKHLVTATDLAVWSRRGNIPYKKAGNSIPDNMMMTGSDHSTFNNVHSPSGAQVRNMTGRLLSFINNDDIPNFNIFGLAIKYIMQLSLPRQGMIRQVRHLLQGKEMIQVKHTSPHYSGVNPLEDVAMAYIIIALKFLFTLDDKTEREHSSFAKQIQEAAPQLNLFVWDDWVVHMTSLTSDTKGKQLPMNTSETMYIRDVASCVCLDDEPKKRHAKSRGKYDSFESDEVRQQLVKPIQRWMKKNAHRPAPRPLSPQAASGSGLAAIRPSDTLDGQHSSDDQDLDDGVDSVHLAAQDSGSRDFSTSTLNYLTNKMDFLQEIKAPTRQLQLLERGAQNVSPPGTEYVLYDRNETLFHKSYDWLLKTCSSHIDDAPKYLHKYVQMLELYICHSAEEKDLEVGDRKRIRYIQGMHRLV